jgi:peptidoglycan/xylan/chitin deacetylase (PgdA/CDA1 family)
MNHAFRTARFYKPLQSEIGRRLPVLLYHHIGPARSGTFPELTVSSEKFDRQMRWLARWGYVGIRPSDWLRWLREGTGLPEKAVLITFDDGYADLTEHALPVLRRHRFGAVVFVVTGQVGGTNTWDEAQGSATHRLMTADQIRYWATQGIEFGAHSRTHVDLTTLTPNELSDEILGSRNDLIKLLGSRVLSFAYPYGIYNRDVYECARGGFDLAFCAGPTMEGFNDLLTDRHLQRRNAIQTGYFVADVLCSVRWGYKPIQSCYEPIQRIRARLSLRSRLNHMKECSAKVIRRSRFIHSVASIFWKNR